MERKVENLDDILSESYTPSKGSSGETRDISQIVEGLIDKYGVNTAANILKSELNEDTDLNTVLKVTNEEGDTETQPANNQQQNNNTQNDQQNQVQLTQDTIKEFEDAYANFETFLNKYTNCAQLKTGVEKVRDYLHKFKEYIASTANNQQQNQQNNNTQNNQQQNQQPAQSNDQQSNQPTNNSQNNTQQQ